MEDMAKQQGIIPLTGTIDNKSFFRLNGQYYAKNKSSLDKERFYTDPAFEGSRKTAAHTKRTAPIASMVYRQLPKKLQKHGVIGKMIGEAGRLLRAGSSDQEIINGLYAKFYPGGQAGITGKK